MKFLPALLFCFCATCPAIGQVTLSGTLRTDDDTPLAYASVRILIDSVTMAGTLSEEDGRFELSCLCDSPASYLLNIRHLATGPVTIPLESMEGSRDLGIVRLEPDSVSQIEEVNITAQQEMYIRKADRFIFRVENNPLASGGDGMDALALTPGLQVTRDAIQMAGRGNVIVTVNDRPLNLSGDDLIAYLRSLSADNIKEIEVIANPDARYDAEGSNGIINIVLKKPMGEGWELRSSSTWEQRSRPSFSENLSLNIRHKGLNVYGFYSPRSRRTRTLEETDVRYTDNYWLTNNERLEQWRSHSYQVGMDLNLGKKTILGVVAEGLIRGEKEERAVAITDVIRYEGPLDSAFRVTNLISGQGNYQTFNLNLSHELDSAGSNISFDADYFTFFNGQDQALTSVTGVPGKANRMDRVESYSPQQIDNLSFNVDGKHVMEKGMVWSWGGKITQTTTRNDFEFRVWNGEQFEADPSRSNGYLYTEQIQAIYGSYEQGWNKTQLEVGLRAENTRITGESITLDTTSSQRYLRLFPSVFVQQQLAEDHSLNLYYGIRLRRPEFWELNPFKYYINPYTYSEGNPGLTPSFTHNLELTYSFRNRYSATVAASRTVNHFQQVPVVATGDNYFYYTRANVGEQQSLGLSLYAPFDPTPWWHFDVSVWAALNAQKVPYLDGTVEYVQPFLWSGLNQRFILGEKSGLSAQLNISYSTRNQSFLYQQEGVFLTNVGLRKQLWNDRANLSLTLYDVFKTFPYRVSVDYQDQQMSFYNVPETRYLQVSFTYRFGDDQVRQKRWRQEGNQEEQNRTGI